MLRSPIKKKAPVYAASPDFVEAALQDAQDLARLAEACHNDNKLMTVPFMYLALLIGSKEISNNELSAIFGCSEPTARRLRGKWYAWLAPRVQRTHRRYRRAPVARHLAEREERFAAAPTLQDVDLPHCNAA